MKFSRSEKTQFINEWNAACEAVKARPELLAIKLVPESNEKEELAAFEKEWQLACENVKKHPELLNIKIACSDSDVISDDDLDEELEKAS